MNLFDLSGRTAVVVGGTSGIGRALAIGLAEAGANVVPTGRRLPLVQEVAAAVQRLGRRTLALTSDVADAASLTRLRDECIEEFGRVDIMLAVAGTTKKVATLDMDEADWSRVIETNLTGTLRACQVFGRHMVEQQYGRIVTIGSVLGSVGAAGRSGYAATKGAVAAMTRSIALEVAADGVTINCIAPGPVRTPMNADQHGTEADRAAEAAFTSSIPTGRWGSPDDVAHAVVGLLAPEAGWTTGSTVFVDGGYTAR
jgi:NAD(P)-dependent dehydrogenase (short-subunit alcohol dehydrogenase family)